MALGVNEKNQRLAARYHNTNFHNKSYWLLKQKKKKKEKLNTDDEPWP